MERKWSMCTWYSSTNTITDNRLFHFLFHFPSFYSYFSACFLFIFLFYELKVDDVYFCVFWCFFFHLIFGISWFMFRSFVRSVVSIYFPFFFCFASVHSVFSIAVCSLRLFFVRFSCWAHILFLCTLRLGGDWCRACCHYIHQIQCKSSTVRSENIITVNALPPQTCQTYVCSEACKLCIFFFARGLLCVVVDSDSIYNFCVIFFRSQFIFFFALLLLLL